MKVVKQNGVRHALTRREAEAIIALFPPDWRRVVNSVVLYQTSGERVYARYYAKAKMLGLFWPSVPHPGLEKVAAIDEMLIAMMAVAELGHLPERLPDIRRSQYLEVAGDIRERCLEAAGVQSNTAWDASRS